MPAHPDRQELSQAIRNALPGWVLVHGPDPFTWAPDMHFRARLARGDEALDVVVRQAWRHEAYEVETFLYRCVLPQLSVRTARMLAAFRMPSNGSEWIVLEDLGDRTAQGNRAEDRKEFLGALGRLHGEGTRILAEGVLRDGPLPRFDGEHIPYGAKRVPVGQWCELLDAGVANSHDPLETWAPGLPRRMLAELADRPFTLLHGDTDFSNGILTDRGVALVDFERGSIGPASLDLGRVVGLMASATELEEYCRCFSAGAQAALSIDMATDWAELGQVYDCLYWICYYIERTKEGADLPDSWREDHYVPARERLSELHSRRQDLLC